MSAGFHPDPLWDSTARPQALGWIKGEGKERKERRRKRMVGREGKGGGGDGKPTLNINAGCGPALAHIALNQS